MNPENIIANSTKSFYYTGPFIFSQEITDEHINKITKLIEENRDQSEEKDSLYYEADQFTTVDCEELLSSYLIRYIDVLGKIWNPRKYEASFQFELSEISLVEQLNNTVLENISGKNDITFIAPVFFDEEDELRSELTIDQNHVLIYNEDSALDDDKMSNKQKMLIPVDFVRWFIENNNIIMFPSYMKFTIPDFDIDYNRKFIVGSFSLIEEAQ